MNIALIDKNGNTISIHPWEEWGTLAERLQPGQSIIELGGHRRVLAARQ